MKEVRNMQSLLRSKAINKRRLEKRAICSVFPLNSETPDDYYSCFRCVFVCLFVCLLSYTSSRATVIPFRSNCAENLSK